MDGELIDQDIDSPVTLCQWSQGFYGHTEGWAVVRAAQGLLLTTSSRAAQGASVASTQMDAAEAVAQLRAARQLGEALSQSARQQGAHGLSSHDGAQAWQHHAEQMDPHAQGRYEGSVGGQEAKKAQGRTLTDPVERFAKPLLHLDTPVSASFVTPTSIHLFSGQDTSLSAQGDVHSTSAHSFSAVSGQTTSLYTHSGGIKAITANAALSLRAHTDAQQIWSEQDLTVQSTTSEIRIQASQSITLTAGQSQLELKGGNITFTCPGTWTVKAASHGWGGGGSQSAMLAGLPAGLAVTTLAHKLPVKLEVDHGLEVDVGSFFYNEPGLRNAQVEVWTSEDPPRLLGGGHVDQIGRSTMIMDDKPESVDVVIGESEWFDVEELQHQDEEDAT